jgi:rod shape-determining protein MreC
VPSFTTSRRRVIAALALTSALLITLDLQGNSTVGSMRRGFGAVFAPFEDAARVVSRPVENAWRGVRDYPDVAEENRRLREQLAEQEATHVLWQAELQDAREAMAAAGLDTSYGTPVLARVIGDSPSNFEQTLTIDKGTNDGIETGQMVVVGQSLVGKITQATSDRATVMLITDPRFAVAVKVENVASDATTEAGASGDDPSTPTSAPDSTGPDSSAPDSTGPDTSSPDTSSPADSAPDTSVAGDGSTSVPGTTVPPGQPADPLAPPVTNPPAPEDDSQPGRQTGSLEGRGAGRNPYVVRVDETPRFGRIEIGAVVRTSGGTNGSSLAAPDLLVGTVLKTIQAAGSGGDALEVVPSVSFGALDFVAVLPRPPGS